MDAKKLNINVKIGERTYPMTVSEDEEEKFRQAGTLAQDQYIKYKKAYSDLPIEDVLAMTIFDLSKKIVDLQSSKGSPEVFLELSDIVNTLDEYIKAQ